MHGSKIARCFALSAIAASCAEPSPFIDAASRDAALDTSSPRDVALDAPASDTRVPPADVQQQPDAPSADPYAAARVACVAEINRYRAMLSLPPYERWTDGEACADRQAAFDAMTNVAHNGFSMSICSPRGNAQNECPRYGGPEALNGCLAQMWAEGPSPDGMWSIPHGHYLNMVGDYIYMGNRVRLSRVACGFSAGGWMVQNFQ